MAWHQVWRDDGECKSCLNNGAWNTSILNDKITRVRDSENTGFCIIHWYNCKCNDCGRTWEEQ